jgi:hypothetical protein
MSYFQIAVIVIGFIAIFELGKIVEACSKSEKTKQREEEERERGEQWLREHRAKERAAERAALLAWKRQHPRTWVDYSGMIALAALLLVGGAWLLRFIADHPH